MQEDDPKDFVIATGIPHSLEQFVAAAFEAVGLDWREHVGHDSALVRPSEIRISVGDSRNAATVLGWKSKVPFRDVITRMVQTELDNAASLF